jgi:hypothetical protein
MRKIDFVLVWGCIGAVIETELTVIAFVDDPPMILGREFGDIPLIPVDPVEQRIKRGTEIEAATASIADLINAQRFVVQLHWTDGLNEREPSHAVSCHETRRVG